MPRIEWTDSLSVGFAKIDEDHKQMVDIYNLFHDAVEEGRAREAVDDCLEALVVYANWHFTHEESIMDGAGYPDTHSHMLEHRELSDHVKELRTQLSNGDDTVIEIILPFIRNWLTNHLMGTDRKLGAYLQKELGPA